MNRKLTLILILLFPLVVAAQMLRVSENKRYLETETGKPFLWIGDTAWELFHKLNREDAQMYLKNRAEKGFSVIQAVVIAEMDGLKTPNAYGETPLIGLNPETPNGKYFEHVDFIVNEAQKLGLFIGMLPTWGDKVTDAHGGGPVIFTEKNARIYGEFLGKRYKAKPIVWILGGDRNIKNEVELKVWRAMANGIKTGSDGKQLISYHPRGASSSHQWLPNESWLDLDMYQSGHEKRYNDVYRYAETLYNLKPAKPFVDAEPAYEDIAIRFWDYCDWSKPLRVPTEVLDANKIIVKKEHFALGFFTAHDVRVHAYLNFLSGACGYTYGNNAIWQMFEKGGNLSIPCLTNWREALDRPGAAEMKHVRTIFEARPFSELIPDQAIIVGSNPKDSLHIRAAISADQSFALVYLSVGQPVTIDLTKMKNTVVASWYNPREGTARKIGTFKNSGNQKFTPPSAGTNNDWLLVLDDKNGKYKLSEFAQKQKVWLDADTGNEMDDLYAIVRLVKDPTIELVGLSSAHFNNPDLLVFEKWNAYDTKGLNTVAESQRLNEQILKALGRLDIPHPIGADRQIGRAWGQQDSRDSEAAQAMIKAVKNLPENEKLDILTIGAMTNLASALILAPEIKSRIRCFALGAQYDPKTKIWNKNEFNIRNDLNAFDYLLNLEGLDLSMMCLQAALPLQFKREDTYTKLDETIEAEKILEDRWREQNPQDKTRVMWDLALVEAYLKPDLAKIETVTTPPENKQRKIKAYFKIDEKALADDFWKVLKK